MNKGIIMKQFKALEINNADDLIFGNSKYPVTTKHGLVIGGGTVYPELNFTLPTYEICRDNFADMKKIYRDVIDDACKRACDLESPGLVVEFEALIEMTLEPVYSTEITKILADVLDSYYNKYSLKSALRVTPNDTRHKNRPPLMRSGELLDNMLVSFSESAKAGGELLSIESTGGKEIHDDALLSCDISKVLFSLAVLGTRDMNFLWEKIVAIAKETNTIPAGDTACGFGNTAMVLAEKKYIPKVFAAIVRAISIVRSLVAYEQGAIGPGKDCGYENPFIKAITGYPMSMEGKGATCAHGSPLGNISAATCDLWSNESVQIIKLLGGMAPTVCFEQLEYDCRLMNQAHKNSFAKNYRNMMVDSDQGKDPQALILSPENVIKISSNIVQETGYYRRSKAAALTALNIIEKAHQDKTVKILPVEESWIYMLGEQLTALPQNEADFIELILPQLDESLFIKKDYSLIN